MEENMKLNVTVEMDWLGYDEDGEAGVSPDQIVKDAIIKGVMDKISGKLIEEVRSQAMEQVKDRVDNTITEMLQNFLEQPVVITDKYGDVKERHASVKEMVKTEFDQFLDARVDSNGKPTTSYSYGSSSSRIDWMISREVTRRAESFMKQVVSEVDAALKKSLDAEAKKRVSDALMTKLDITSILNK
jgi:uncharacterized membrane protein YheB (UPF0754 family)